MTFTVPTSKADPGRSADIASRIHIPQTGSIIAQFGNDVMQGAAATERNQEQEARAAEALAARDDKAQLDRAKVDMMGDLNALRLQVMEIGDPLQMDTAWTTGLADLRGRYASALSAGNQEAFGLAFDQAATPMTFSVGKDALGLRQSQAKGAWAELEKAVTQTAAFGDYDSRRAAVAGASAMMDDYVARGIYTPDEGARLKIALAAQAANTAAIEAIKADPSAFLAQLDDGLYPEFEGETTARYRVQALAAIDSLAEQQAAQVERDANAREKVMAGQIDTAIAIMAEGATPDLAFMASADFSSHPKRAKLEYLLELQQEKGSLLHLGLKEIDALIATAEATPLSEEYGLARIEALRDIRKVVADGMADPIARADALGLGTDMPEFDPANPGEYAAFLSGRAATGEHMVTTGRADTFQVYRKDELDGLAARFGPGGDPDERTSWLLSLDRALGDEAPAIAGQATGGDTATGFAAAMLRSGAPVSTVRTIFAGQRRVEDKTVNLPARGDLLNSFSAKTHDEYRKLFEYMPGLLEAATYIYAENGGDPKVVDGEQLLQSVQLALGATADPRSRDGELSVGGLQKFDTIGTWRGGRDDYYVTLPPGVAQRDVERALDTVIDALDVAFVPDRVDRQTGASFEGTYSAPDLSVLERISLSGLPPDLGDPTSPDYDPAALFSNMRLKNHYVDGKPSDYFMFERVTKSGQVLPLADTSGQRAFLFRMSDLLEQAR